MHSNKRKLNVLLFIAASVFISIAATGPDPDNLPVPKKSLVNDTGHFKNLKVLPKNISEAQLDTIMNHFKAALGVRCNFCHVWGSDGKPDFANDAKEEKNIARYMMTMTAGINKTYFNSENSTMPDTIAVVKCVTCHHGNPHPDEASMAMGNQGNMPPPGMPPPGMPADSNHKMPPPPNQ